MKTLIPLLRTPLFICTALLPVLLFSCAHQVSPGGGPEDKTGPTILATVPASGAVGIDRKSRIIISFSEWIAKPSALKSISILPPLDGGSTIKINAQRLEIVPAKPFAEATTYHIVVTSGLTDLRNNPISSSFTLVFSTGTALDSGEITGCVVDPAKRFIQPTVALFSIPKAPTDTLFLQNPDYLTQGDSGGYFSIENVRPGTYQLLAFVDKNNNRRPGPGTEDAYAPSRQNISISKQTVSMTLFPVESDTASPRVKSVKPVSSKEILCTWSGTVDSLHGCSEPAWSIVPSGKKGNSIAASQIFWFDNRSRSILLLSDTLSIAQYHLIATYRRKLQSSSLIITDTMLFNGINSRDTVQPALQSCSPTGTTGLLPEIRLLFTEPVSLSRQLSLIDSLGDSIPLNNSQSFADTAVLHPARRLHTGSRYRLLILKSFGKDLAGNKLKTRDTTDTVACPEFKTIDPDSLAVSLKGCAPCLAADAKRKWQFLPFSGNAIPLVSADTNNCFRFDSLPAGKGFVAYFSDENNNNRPDKGILLPFTPPEPYVILPDTVEARARWEIEGVVLKPCDGCRPHKSAPAAVEKKK